MIRDEFRDPPQNVDAALGDDAVFHCKPPKGDPEPRVRWKKDGEQIMASDRVYFDDDGGGLRIREVRKDDAGMYVCLAFNVGGQRESKPARLAVFGQFFICINWTQ